jgi:O-antigen ligase
MFKLRRLKNQKINITSFVQILFYTFPLSFILGNLAVSLNCVLFILFGLFLIKKNSLPFRFNIFFWVFFIFLLYFFINTLIQFRFPGLVWIEYVPTAIEAYGEFSIKKWMSVNGDPTLKAFFLVRFLLLIFVINCLFFNKIIHLKTFFLSSFICALFVSFDIIVQYIFGTDLFGYKKIGAWSSGPFGDEKIATTYLKNFSFISFFYFFEFIKDKKYNKTIFILFVTLYLIAALLGGNRMPMLMLLIGCVLVVIFIARLRILMSLSLASFLIFFLLLVNNDKYFKITYSSFIGDLNIIKLLKVDKNKKIINKDTKKEKKDLSKEKSNKMSLLHNSSHNRVFWTAILIWKEQPLTGLGFKSYRLKCVEFLAKELINKKNNNEQQQITCANHAHNYYLEILAESGILGLSCFFILFIILLKKSFIFLIKNFKNNNQNEFFIIPLIIILLLEIWPIQSTGSFFTSWGATFFWLNIGLLIPNISKKKNY